MSRPVGYYIPGPTYPWISPFRNGGRGRPEPRSDYAVFGMNGVPDAAEFGSGATARRRSPGRSKLR